MKYIVDVREIAKAYTSPYVLNVATDVGNDTYGDGSILKPFKTIQASINKVIANADNSTHPYIVYIGPGTYSETLTFNNSLLYNLTFEAIGSSVQGAASSTVVNSGGTVLQSTSNNTNLATLVFIGITFNGNVNLTGDINNTNFGSSQILFSNCGFNLGTSGITLNNVNNVSWYGGQIQGSGSTSTFTNVALAYIEGAEGFHAGTTLNLVQNNGTNQPSQALGNYLLLSETKCYSTLSIDAGSELDALLSYFGSGSAITNNGVLHSWQTGWNGTLTCNNGSTTRVQGDIFLNIPTINSGATFTNRGILNAAAATLGASAVWATNVLLSLKDGHIKSAQTTAPTTTTNANAGTSASSSVSHATDISGIANLITGNLLTTSSGVQMTVNFNKSYNVAPIVILTPANAATATNSSSVGTYVTSAVGSFSINFANAGPNNTTFAWNYHVIETQ